MRVSDLQPAAYPQSPAVEKPNSDAHALFTTDFAKTSFIEANGDVEIVWINDITSGKFQPLRKDVENTVT
jgi:hypothetical protein